MQGTTPSGVAELVKDLITDKVVCDVGCGDGRFLVELKRYAKEVIGIEEVQEWAELAAGRGFDILAIPSWHQPLPKADVYYLWTRDAMGVYLKAKYEGTTGTFIFGHTVRPSLSAFLKRENAETRQLPHEDFKVHILKL
jgi:SAM-dependent methyltransferase